MRKSLIVLPLLFAAAACGQKAEEASESSVQTESSARYESADVASDATSEGAASAAKATPDIDTSVAPGVAFDFRYSFALESDRIGSVQEDHAQACKKLGIAKCRVTGMDYRANGNDVSAMMAFKIAPEYATDFTRDAKRIVEQAEGELTNAVLNGTDLGSKIAISDADADELRAELATIEKQLAMPNLSKQVRARLVEQMTSIREQLRNVRGETRGDKAALAMTPVVFDYQTAHGLPGFDGNSPVAGVASASLNSFLAMIKFVLLAVGMLAPWALLGGAAFWLVKRLRRAQAPVVTSE